MPLRFLLPLLFPLALLVLLILLALLRGIVNLGPAAVLIASRAAVTLAP